MGSTCIRIHFPTSPRALVFIIGPSVDRKHDFPPVGLTSAAGSPSPPSPCWGHGRLPNPIRLDAICRNPDGGKVKAIRATGHRSLGGTGPWSRPAVPDTCLGPKPWRLVPELGPKPKPLALDHGHRDSP